LCCEAPRRRRSISHTVYRPAGLPPCVGLGYTRRLFTEFAREPSPMEIQPILNTIKDLTERSQSIRGYL
jgi:hypothetical protein